MTKYISPERISSRPSSFLHLLLWGSCLAQLQISLSRVGGRGDNMAYSSKKLGYLFLIVCFAIRVVFLHCWNRNYKYLPKIRHLTKDVRFLLRYDIGSHVISPKVLELLTLKIYIALISLKRRRGVRSAWVFAEAGLGLNTNFKVLKGL